MSNTNNRVETLDATFRVEGKAAELWHADTGATRPASYRIAGGRTIVPLHLEPNECRVRGVPPAGLRAFAQRCRNRW